MLSVQVLKKCEASKQKHKNPQMKWSWISSTCCSCCCRWWQFLPSESSVKFRWEKHFFSCASGHKILCLKYPQTSYYCWLRWKFWVCFFSSRSTASIEIPKIDSLLKTKRARESPKNPAGADRQLALIGRKVAPKQLSHCPKIKYSGRETVHETKIISINICPLYVYCLNGANKIDR